MAHTDGAASEPIVIKKYANRRLYNTATSSYVTLDNLCRLVKLGTDFVVYDAKSGEDITRAVLAQIIFEQENKGQNLLPIPFLRQLIGFYDDGLRAFLPAYLELSMETFAKNQEQMRRYLDETWGNLFPFAQFQEFGKQNLALFQRALAMFSPSSNREPPAADEAVAPARPDSEEIQTLKRQLDDLQRRLDSLNERGD